MAVLKSGLIRCVWICVIACSVLPCWAQLPTQSRIPVHVKQALAQSDMQQALPWLESAAKSGHTLAALKMSNLYRLGEGVERDKVKALEFMLIAAGNGSAEANYLLGLEYKDQGLTDEANTAFGQAVEQGYQPAIQAQRKHTHGSTSVFKLLGSQLPDAVNISQLDFTARDDMGRTALIVAVQQQNTPWVKALIRRGESSLSDQDKTGNTALHYAVNSNQDSTVRELLKYGARVDVANKQGTIALHLAVQKAHIDVIKALLEAVVIYSKSITAGGRHRCWQGAQMMLRCKAYQPKKWRVRVWRRRS